MRPSPTGSRAEMAAGSTFRCCSRLNSQLFRCRNVTAQALYGSQAQKRMIQTSATLWDVSKVNMPALSPTMQEGTIIQWHKKEGDAVAPGDVLCDIQTDKSTIGLETEEEGILAKIIKPDNSTGVKVGAVIALMVEEGEDWQSVEVSADDVAAPSQGASPAATPTAPAPAAAPTEHHYIQGIGPAVRTILDQYDIKMSDVVGTGHEGRLLKGDLLRHIKEKNLNAKSPQQVALPTAASAAPAAPAAPTPAPSPKPAAPAPLASPPPAPRPPTKAAPPSDTSEFTDLELTNMRSVIAKRLTESKTTIPHSYASIDCNLDALLKLRKELKGDGVKVSVNDFIIKACGAALKRVPEVNAVWSGEGSRQMDSVDICVAVATDSGLITPIVRAVNQLGLEGISTTVKDLAGRARNNKLLPEEFQGGTFTISNLGMFGIREFSAVINPPQASILAVGATRVCLDPDTPSQATNVMSVTLSSDARIVDEFLADRFLEEFRVFMENPLSLLASPAAPRAALQAPNQFNKEALFAK